jgi:Fe2+ or Zn2+ uptake regulation protein
LDIYEAMLIIKNNGYKLTPQRKAILEVLSEQKHNLLTSNDINNACSAKEVKTNITTIYRNLDLLIKFDIVHKVLDPDGTALYQFNCSNHHHHHLICKNCGSTEVIDYCPIKTLTKLSESKSFHLTEHKLELYGYCKKCN